MELFLTLFRMIPMVLSAVQSAESFLPIPGAGKIKLDLVLAQISHAYEAAIAAGALSGKIPWLVLAPAITSMIASAVAAMNAANAAATPKPK